MQEIKNKRRFALLAGLTVVTLLAFWWVQPENRLDISVDLFRVADLNTISRVELKSKSDLVNLVYDGGRWRVNNSFTADAGMVKVLFATLQQATPRRTVASARRDSIFSDLAERGVRVSLYAGEDLKKQFYAGGNAAKTQAFYADPANGEVYVMTIPGYRVYVSGILEMDKNGWRDKFVFGFNWQNFKSLEVQFPGRTSENFTVAMLSDYFGVQGLAETDTAKLNTFLDNVSLLTVEQYISEPRLIDSLQHATPQLIISVTDIGKRTYNLNLYAPGKSVEGFGLIQDSLGGIFNRRKIEALLKPKSFFIKK